MSCVTYAARRALAPGHAIDQIFGLPLRVIDLMRPSGSVLRETQQSISGKVEIQYYGEVRRWAVTLEPIRVRDAAIHYEFLRSTEDGQAFTFDPYGTLDSPALPLSVVRDDEGYTDDSFIREGRGGITDWVTLAFKVRES